LLGEAFRPGAIKGALGKLDLDLEKDLAEEDKNFAKLLSNKNAPELGNILTVTQKIVGNAVNKVNQKYLNKFHEYCVDEEKPVSNEEILAYRRENIDEENAYRA